MPGGTQLYDFPLFDHDPTPLELEKVYSDGFPGASEDPANSEQLFSDGLVETFSDACEHLRGLHEAEDRKVVPLFLCREKLDPGAYGQEAQKTGDCVSHGDRSARDTTQSVEIVIQNQPEKYVRGATESTYGARGHGGAGMDPSRATRFVTETGFLYRRNYPELGIDLSNYNVKVGINWGRRGVPEAVKEECRKHQVGKYVVPESLEEALDLFAAGYACHSGQNVGFRSSPNRQGYHPMSGRWNHDMATVGYDISKEVWPVPVVFVQNSWGCVDEQTEVLTREGWKRFRLLGMQDEIATLNPDTHEMEYHQPTQLHRYRYDGMLHSYQGSSVDLMVTPNHNMYCGMRHRERYDPSHWRLLPSEDMPASVRFKKDAIWKGERIEYHEHGLMAIPMNEWLTFLGWFLTEGSTHKKTHVQEYARTTACGTVQSERQCRVHNTQISQVKEDYIAEIDKMLLDLPFNFYRNGKDWVCSNRYLCDELAVFGKAHEKFIPDYAKGLPPNQLEYLYQAMMKGDGHSEKGRNTFYTSSKRLADDFQEICIKTGRSADVTAIDRRGRDNGTGGITRHVEYRVEIQHRKSCPYHAGGWKPELVEYHGDVHCATVPNHVMYVRRNGKAVWTGNSFNTQPEDQFHERNWPRMAGMITALAEDWWDRFGRCYFYADIEGIPAKSISWLDTFNSYL